MDDWDDWECAYDTVQKKVGRRSKRAWSNVEPFQLWDDGVVPWSYVSTEADDDAVHVDVKVGLTKDDVDTVKVAMNHIESKTCIRFKLEKPLKGEPWLFISRDARASDLACQIDYKKSDLIGKDIEGLGEIYGVRGCQSDFCFRGFYACSGKYSPQNMVISEMKLDKNQPDYEESSGRVVHELLHNLGLGHTHQRQDALENIEINLENIQPRLQSQYEVLTETNTYGTDYDCMSTMHYRDTKWITDEAKANGGKAMVAIKPEECDLASANNKLSDGDVKILKKMYCDHERPGAPMASSGEVTSPNYPNTYPNDIDHPTIISVPKGARIELTFWAIDIETDPNCGYDKLTIYDSDDDKGDKLEVA